MGKIKSFKTIDSWEVNQISISQIAKDWGLELIPRAKRGSYTIKCPDPKHTDKNLGNCILTDDGNKNCFHCFACGAGGGPIDLVMHLSKCDFVTAKEMLAYKYGKVKEAIVDCSKIPPKWEGLTIDEYAEFGLHNVSIQLPYGTDDRENVLYKYERYSLRDFARDDPEMHDEMLIGKFGEKIEALEFLRFLIMSGYLKKFGVEHEFDDEWEKAFQIIVDNLKRLLKKGLSNKALYPFDLDTANDPTLDSEPDFVSTKNVIERKLEDEIVKLILAKKAKAKAKT